MQLGTNVVGHYFFTTLLLPALEAAAAGGVKARVVNTSSFAAYMTSKIDYEAAKDGPARRKHSVTELYWISKLVRSRRRSDSTVVLIDNLDAFTG